MSAGLSALLSSTSTGRWRRGGRSFHARTFEEELDTLSSPSPVSSTQGEGTGPVSDYVHTPVCMCSGRTLYSTCRCRRSWEAPCSSEQCVAKHSCAALLLAPLLSADYSSSTACAVLPTRCVSFGISDSPLSPGLGEHGMEEPLAACAQLPVLRSRVRRLPVVRNPGFGQSPKARVVVGILLAV